MKIEVNQELINLNIDILAKAGIKKSTINKLHKLKGKKLGDLANMDEQALEKVVAEDETLDIQQLASVVNANLIEFTLKVFEAIKNDEDYVAVMLHVNNHTHQEIAQRFNTSKEKIKQNIGKLLQNLFTLVDAIGSKLIENKPYIGIEELEEIFELEDDYKLLLLAFKAHDTKWLYHVEAECLTKK